MSTLDDIATIQEALAFYGASLPDLSTLTTEQKIALAQVAAKTAPNLRAINAEMRANEVVMAQGAATLAASYAAQSPVTEIRVHRLALSQEPLSFAEILLFPPADAGVTWQVTLLIRLSEMMIQAEVFQGTIGDDGIAHTTANIDPRAAPELLARWQAETQTP